MVLKFKALYALVFENKLVKYLLRSTPSLAEFTMAGKAWFHTSEKRSDGSPKYDRIVVDAPATGHAITFLSVARTVADIAPDGIMKTASEKMAGVIESKDSSCLHIACLPEEMPVNEALDIIAVASKKLRMATGIGFVNRMSTPIVDASDKGVFARLKERAESEARIRPFVIAGERRRDREALQESYAVRFESESQVPVIRIPELEVKGLDLQAIELIAGIFKNAAGDG
jgi:anion-transporting  ArsA/GET3 family ATPase